MIGHEGPIPDSSFFEQPKPPTILWTGEGKEPYRHFDGDAGFDLFTNEPMWIPPEKFVDIPTEVYCQLPAGWWGMITGRSSTLRKRGILVTQAIIDNGYRGELFCGVWNLTGHNVFVPAGDRIAQFIPIPLFPGRMERVAELDSSARGAQGFGSSGT